MIKMGHYTLGGSKTYPNGNVGYLLSVRMVYRTDYIRPGTRMGKKWWSALGKMGKGRVLLRIGLPVEFSNREAIIKIIF